MPINGAQGLSALGVCRTWQRSALVKSTFKQEMKQAYPRVNDVDTFKAVRAHLWKVGGPSELRQALEYEGYLKPDKDELTTTTMPFNVFARIAHQDGLERATVRHWTTCS